MKNAEIDALVTTLSFLREAYCASEITEKGDAKILNDKYPDFFKDLHNQIGYLERIIASGLNNDREKRLLTLATKHCPKSHHDWNEIMQLAGEK